MQSISGNICGSFLISDNAGAVLTTKNSCHTTDITYLVKADQIYLSTDIDPLWADAENANVFEASLGVHNASCHSGWQRWRHSDGDDVQRLNDDGFSWHLKQADGNKSGFIRVIIKLWQFDDHF